MIVKIERRHCENREYDSCSHCPLHASVKELKPELDFRVFLHTLLIFNGQQSIHAYFDSNLWNESVFNNLRDGKIDSVTLEIDGL